MIELDSITKYYGNYPAVTDISFRVEKGEILGFLGPNGAGKSTTMKIITGFVPPTEGTCSVAGSDILTDSLAARRHIGYLPETVPLYTDMTVSDYLEFMGRIRELKGQHLHKRVDEVVQICRLEEYFDTFISKLSKGFRQRVGIAQSIIHEPDVLILDEPTIGIDPIQVVETRELIKNLYSHKNFKVAENKSFSTRINENSDVVISMSFASSGFEAMCLGKKSFYVDLTNVYNNSYYDNFQKLVSHSNKEALDNLEHWMKVDKKDVLSKYKDIFENLNIWNNTNNASEIIKNRIIENLKK